MKDRLKGWLLKRWWGRNLANIITITGFVGAYWILFCTNWSVPWKLAGYVGMEIPDWADGKVARWLGITEGIGKIIDPIADKCKKFFALYFLFQIPALVFRPVIGLVSLGEISVLVLIGCAVYLVFKLEHDRLKKRPGLSGWLDRMNYWKIFENALKEVFKNWQVNQEGKITMFCYVLMFGSIFLRSIWMDRDEFIYLYVIFAAIGFRFRYSSFLDYLEKFLEWQNKASAKAKGVG
jgi:phosphatidylglycerophosphate synthase